MEVKDGTGTGNRLKINSEKQALTFSEIEEEATHHAKLGETFIVGSDFIALNTATTVEQGIFRIQNDSTTKNIYIGYLRVCNTAPTDWRLYKDGTDLSGTETTPVAYNTNLNSAVTLDATIAGGEVGSTTSTNWGTQIAQWTQAGPGHSLSPFAGSFILGPTDSIILTADASASADYAANQTACVTMQVWQA